MAKVEKIEPKEIGKVGDLRVVEYTPGQPLLEYDEKCRLGCKKVKKVLARSDAGKAFLARYDVEKPQNVVPQASVEAAKQIEELRKSKSELEARLLALSQASAQATVPSRVDPLQKAA